jgi:hypothetical protein
MEPRIDFKSGGIDSSESIPGLHKRLQIRAQMRNNPAIDYEKYFFKFEIWNLKKSEVKNFWTKYDKIPKLGL